MTHVENLDRFIKEHPFFQGADPAVCETISGCAANERFNAGEYIFHEGGMANRFYLIRHGSVALEMHVPGRDPVIIETLHEGDVLGWSWLTPPFKWRADARAMQLVRAVSLDAQCLRQKYETDHNLGYELFRRFIPVMARRIEAGRLQMIDVYAKAQDRR